MPEPTPIEFPPHRTLCSLAEAAKIAGCSSVELLRSAARDVLRLCVRVPSGIAVLSVDMSVLPGGRYEKASLLTLVRAGVENSPVTAASIVKDISLLFLDGTSCQEIGAFGNATRSIFPSGGVFDASFNITEVFPIEYLSRFAEYPPSSRRFVTYVDGRIGDYPGGATIGNPSSIRLDDQTVLVTRADLEKYIDGRVATDKLRPRNKNPHTSEKLIALRAAAAIWRHEGPPPGQAKSIYDKFNSDIVLPRIDASFKEIEASVMKKDMRQAKGRGVLANFAASIVRPKFARTGGKSLVEITDDTYQTPELRSLERASNVWSIVEGAAVNRHDPLTYPNADQIKRELLDAFADNGIVRPSDYLRKNGASVIRPEWAEDGRHYNQPKRPPQKR